MIYNLFQLDCDACSISEMHEESKDQTISRAESDGWIMTEDQHFCSKTCLRHFEDSNKNILTFNP